MPHIVIGTAGHIDHGKSALVTALTGTDPDRLKEEKARGITIDLGFAHWSHEDLHVAFVDVPGHEKFVRNMLAGVGGIDCVLLVVAADESVMPQTREHFEICRLLEIPSGLIVLTKSDLVDAEMLDLVRLEAKELVQGSFLQESPVVAASSRTGAGLDDLRAELVTLGRRVGGRSSDGVPRLPIDRVFSMKGFGTVVTGTLVSGRIIADQELVVLPAGRTVKVRGLQVHGHKQPQAEAGQRVALNLGGVEVADLSRGDTLTSVESLPVTRVVDATIELLGDAKPLRHGARVRFHQGTAEIMGRVGVSSVLGVANSGTSHLSGAASESEPWQVVGPTGIQGSPDQVMSSRGAPSWLSEGAERPPHDKLKDAVATVPAGARAFVRIRLEQPAVVTRGDRFILRAYSPPVTIAGGQVLDPTPPRSGLRTAGGRARFERLRFEPAGGRLDPSDTALAWMIEEAGSAGLDVRRVTSRAGITPGFVQPTIARLTATGRVTLAGQHVLAAGALEALKQHLVTALRAHHQANPLSEGVPREEARVRIFGKAGPGVFGRALDDLVRDQVIEARDKIALRGHRVSLSTDEQRAQSAIEEAYRHAGLKPLDSASLATGLGLAADVVDRMIKLLLRQKILVRIDTLLFHESALRQLKEDVAALKRQASGMAQIDVATFKERYGVTRKFAIPLLEYLDRERVTRRVGDVRQVL